MSTATRIQTMTNFRGDAALYRLDPPYSVEDDFDGTTSDEYVIVSAVDLGLDSFVSMFDSLAGTGRSSETMIFPATEDGTVTSWGELGMVDHKSHEDALTELGYAIAPAAIESGVAA